MVKRRATIENRRKMTFNELIVQRPWDKWNMEKHGKTNSSMLIYHPTWLQLLKESAGPAKEAYENSIYQKDLNKFIIEELWDYVYKKDKYDKNNLPQVQ